MKRALVKTQMSGTTMLLGAGSTCAALNSASAPSAATVADAVWDEILSDHVVAGSTGEKLGVVTRVEFDLT